MVVSNLMKQKQNTSNVFLIGKNLRLGLTHVLLNHW